MALDTYANLKTSIASWLNRDDLTSFIPDFISLVEADLERKLRVRQQLIRAVTIPATDEPRGLLPGDFLELKAIQFNSDPIRVPQYVTPAWMRNYRRQSAARGGVPEFYTIEAGEFLFDVTPTDTELEILYYQKTPRLSDSVTSNWILDSFPDLYLYGALIHSAPFLKDDERVAVWDTLYSRGLSDLKLQDNRSEANAAPVQQRTRRNIP